LGSVRAAENSTSGSGLASVAMMQATDQGHCDNLALVGWFDRTRFRTILRQGAVWAVAMVIF
jgi:hypothetical protein